MSGTNADLDRLSKEEIPEAIEELKAKHLQLNELIQWCESSYQAGNKKAVQAQTKEYLVDSLESVARDVEVVGSKITEFLVLEVNAIDDIGDTVSKVHQRLDLAKAQNAKARLDKFLPPRADDGRPRQDKVAQLNDAEQEVYMKPLVAYERNMAKRIEAFDSVGDCLH